MAQQWNNNDDKILIQYIRISIYIYIYIAIHEMMKQVIINTI